MRIAKVALAFFSIGFLAGSFERAAGLGHSEPSRAAQDRRVGDAIIFSAAHAFSDYGWRNRAPEELTPPSSMTEMTSDSVPQDAVAALTAMVSIPDSGARITAVRYDPDRTSVDAMAALAPVVPQERPSLRLRRMSEPDTRPRSKMPGPFWMSLPSGEPWDATPKRDGSEPEAQVASPEFIMPFERGRVTSLFNQGRYHPAIDLAGSLGSRVHATTRKQRVIFTGWKNGYGNTVVTRDDTGRMHLYGHLQRIATKIGAVLEQGFMLGTLGSTGHSTGPHVHYEVKTRAGAHVDPVTLLFGRRVGRGYAWNGSRSVTRVAARTDRQPRPR